MLTAERLSRRTPRATRQLCASAAGCVAEPLDGDTLCATHRRTDSWPPAGCSCGCVRVVFAEVGVLRCALCGAVA